MATPNGLVCSPRFVLVFAAPFREEINSTESSANSLFSPRIQC
jgi:hypothetical protein